MINARHYNFNLFQVNTMLVGNGSGECVIIDPGCCTAQEKSCMEAAVREQGLRPAAILLTHAHPDHTFGVKALRDAFGGIPVYMHPDDEETLAAGSLICSKYGLPAPDTDFERIPVHEGDVLKLAGMEFEVIGTPGHTPGGVCYLVREDGVLFSGDTLFAGTIGRTDLPGGDYDKLIVSVMDKLMGLDSDTRVFPGHGGRTTIGWERTHNPFLQPFNEPEEPMGPDEAAIEIHG